MKSNYKNQFLAAIVLIITALTSCEKQSSIGVEVLPSGDLITTKNVIQKNIRSFTFSEDSIRTDEASNSLLGSFTDSVFGNTTIGFASQFRLYGFPDFGRNNPQPDSISLYLYYRIIYGDTITKQRFNVFELKSSIDPDESYRQNVDLKSMAYDKLLGQIEYTPRIKLDTTSKDTFYQLINIPLDFSLAEKLFYADSLMLTNNDIFLEFFKGLYIETEKQHARGGAILSLETAASGSFRGSAVVLYYHNDSLKSKLDVNKDSVLLMPYIISSFSARVNNITHDYTETPFYHNLNSETTEDSLIYVQAMGGLKSRIIIDGLSSWKDSVNIAINKAELIFQIDTVASQIKKYPPPNKLLFTVVDENGKEILPKDYVFSPSFYGGGLRKNYTYHFNITQHLQEIIDGKTGNYGFFLTPAQKNNEANRVILKGSTSKTGIKLIITYSKFTE
ncbi:MAG: hypothetical protein FD181_513 [Prolixibacteraceae bacterium]|nr:MAG: hypothetical protein FD181_513 [Prolixibacteraceae bacterium]